MRMEALIGLIITCISPILLLVLLFMMEGRKSHSLKIKIACIVLIALLVCFWPVIFLQCPFKPADSSIANACYKGFDARLFVFQWFSIPAVIGTFFFSTLKAYRYQHENGKSTHTVLAIAIATGVCTTAITVVIGGLLFLRYVFYFIF